jgi:alkylation response protein AidB-like acyl-CoA dehydrogenase
MDTELTSAHHALGAEVRAFLAAHWSTSERQNPSTIREFRALATERGYLFGWVPRELGGGGTQRDPLAARVIATEFLAAGAPGEPDEMGVAMLVPTLLEWGTPDQRTRFIPPTLTGEITWCQGYSEPSAGSDLGALRTSARPDGDGWLITGHKIWTSGADTADHMFLLARTEPGPRDSRGLSYFLVDLAQPGVIIRPLRQLTGQAGFAEVILDGARSTELVGARGQGWQVSRSTLRHERSMVGGAARTERLFAGLVRLARATRADGTTALADPVVRDELVRIHALVEQQRLAGWLRDSRIGTGRDAGLLPLTAKLASTEIADRISALALTLLAEDGLLAPIGRGPQRWLNQWLGSLGLAIAAGTNNIQRDIIASRGLGLPAELGTGR